MTKEELAMKIDAYADAKSSGNKYLVKKMIQEMEVTLTELFGNEETPISETEVVSD
jgi:uncharacterized protein (DUF2344 family)